MPDATTKNTAATIDDQELPLACLFCGGKALLAGR